MSKVVTQDDLFSVLRDIETRLTRLESAVYQSGQTSAALSAEVKELRDLVEKD